MSQETEFLASLDRIRRGQDGETIKPAFDPKLARDVAADAVRGRRIEDFHKALERCGFRWVAANRLPPMMGAEGPILHKVGMWCRNVEPRMWMTADQICAWFPGGPEEFWLWFEEQAARHRAQRAGLVLPR